MSYAYIQGQEREALVYFQRLLNQPLSPVDRAQLERLVQDLREKVQTDDDERAADAEPALHNARPLNLQQA